MSELVMAHVIDVRGNVESEPVVLVMDGGAFRLELDDERWVVFNADEFEVAFANEQMRQVGRAA